MIKKIKRELHYHNVVVKEVSKNKLDYIMIFFDFLYCRLRFHITHDEYLKYQFYNFKNRYRKNFIMVYHSLYKYRNENVRKFISPKYSFYKLAPDFYSRDIIYAPNCGEQAFLEFIKKHNRIIVKPDIGSFGKGIEEFIYESDEKSKEIYNKFSLENPVICEEFINQHHLLQELNPFCVNTVRIVSIFKDGETKIISAVLKTGTTPYSIVDNMHSGGIGAQIDIKTGIVTTFGKDYKFNSYSHHPVSDIQFIGMNIPHWDKVIEFVKKAHVRFSNWLIFGWDIAITETGIEFVEANSCPGPLLMQTMDMVPKGEEFLPMLNKDVVTKEWNN